MYCIWKKAERVSISASHTNSFSPFCLPLLTLVWCEWSKEKGGDAAVLALMRPSLRSFCRTRLACYSAQLDRGTRTLTFFFLPCAKKKGVFTLMLEWKRRSLECVWDEWKKRDPKERHPGDMEIHKSWLVPVSFLGPDSFFLVMLDRRIETSALILLPLPPSCALSSIEGDGKRTKERERSTTIGKW